MVLVYAIAHFEVFLVELAKILYSCFWQALKSKDKTLTYEQILTCDDFEQLKYNIIEIEISKFSFVSINSRIEILERKFCLDFSHKRVKGIRNNWNCIELDGLIEIHSSRNLIVHNYATVNRFYLQQNPNTSMKIGDKLILNSSYLVEALSLLFRVRGSFSSVVLDKIKRDYNPQKKKHA
jgi:hypothetical protein